jgi:NTP pyrophosphatase (non-canonical NTP hydrolase)
MEFSQLQMKVAQTAKEHGFWDVDAVNNPASVDRKLMLIVGEVAEAHEEYRARGLVSYTTESRCTAQNAESDFEHEVVTHKPEGFAVELADAVIRILDLCEQLDINLEEHILLKDGYNKSRPYRHGKRF